MTKLEPHASWRRSPIACLVCSRITASAHHHLTWLASFTHTKRMPLAAFMDSIFYNQPISPSVREWLLKAFLHYLHHGGKDPLDRFLGLAPIDAGTSSPSTHLGVFKRNLHLMEALRKIALDDSVTSWGRCQRLAAEITKFESRTWK